MAPSGSWGHLNCHFTKSKYFGYTYILVLANNVGEEILVDDSIVTPLLQSESEQNFLLHKSRLKCRINLENAVVATLFLLEHLKGFSRVTRGNYAIGNLVKLSQLNWLKFIKNTYFSRNDFGSW